MARTESLRAGDQRRLVAWLPIVAVVAVLVRIAVTLFVPAPAPEVRGANDLVHWVDPKEAPAQLVRSGKPALYEFSAEWCGPCKTMDAQVFHDVRVATQINRRFIPVRVIDRMQEEGRNRSEVATLLKRYEVKGFPTLVVTDAKGKVIHRIEGYRNKAEVAKALEDVAGR